MREPEFLLQADHGRAGCAVAGHQGEPLSTCSVSCAADVFGKSSTDDLGHAHAVSGGAVHPLGTDSGVKPHGLHCPGAVTKSARSRPRGLPASCSGE